MSFMRFIHNAYFTAPEPLAHLYSRSYYRATWISNALDAGFATAMSIHKPKWLKDLAGPIFGLYYLFWTEQAEEKVRVLILHYIIN